jgi:hypothetical protein
MTSALGVRQWAHKQAEEYRHGEDRPLGGYVAFLGIYSGGTIGAGLVAKALGRKPPRSVSPWDLAQLILATHKVSRLIAKDPITSPLRVPFTTFEGTSAPAELKEAFGHTAPWATRPASCSPVRCAWRNGWRPHSCWVWS